MVNKIKSAIGGLAILAATATATTNAPFFTKIEYVAPDTVNTNGAYRLSGYIKLGDTNKYDVVCSSDLSNSNSWAVSTINTNLGVKALYESNGVNSPFSLREPISNPQTHFKLKSRSN